MSSVATEGSLGPTSDDWRAEAVRYVLFTVGIATALCGVYLRAGAFHAEFSGPDEAAYVVSGIMVREYLAGALWHGVSPTSFAQQYYAHYPKVAIGHWPPLYFLIQGMWLLLSGVSRASVLALSAFLSALLASLTVVLCRREGLRWTMAATAGAVTVLLPIHLASLLEIGSDVIASVAILVAALSCQRWAIRENRKNGMWFALSAAFAILCKATAFVLLLVAPLTLLLARRGTLPHDKSTPRVAWLSSRETWRVVALVAVLVLPWYYYAREWIRDELVPGAPSSVMAAMLTAALYNARTLLSLCGVAMLPLALVSLRSGWHRRAPAIAALPVATWMFLSLLSPHTEARLFMAVVPVIVFAAAIAANRLLPKVQEVALIGALCVAYGPTHVAKKSAVGFVPSVDWIDAQSRDRSEHILISSNGGKEGALISEFALRQPMPRHTILRASKLFESSTWMDDNVELHAHSAADVLRILDDQHVTLVVRHFARSGRNERYGPSLTDALSGWQLQREFGEVRVYARAQ